MHVETSGVGGRYIPQTKSNNSKTNSSSKTNNKPVQNIANNISKKVNNTKANVTSNISKLGDSLSIVGNKIADTANQTKKQVSNIASQAKDKFNQSTAAISNTVAKGISFTDGIKIHKGPLTISTSASVSQKVGNDKNGTVAANVDVSSGKPKVNTSIQNGVSEMKISDNSIQAGSNGVKIKIADNKYYNSDLSIGGTSFSKKSAEVTLVEHSIQTKPAANNMTSEIKTSVSVNTDTLKKVGTVAAGVAIVAGSAYAVAQTGGFSYPAVASTLALGLAMVKTGFTR